MGGGRWKWTDHLGRRQEEVDRPSWAAAGGSGQTILGRSRRKWTDHHLGRRQEEVGQFYLGEEDKKDEDKLNLGREKEGGGGATSSRAI